MVTTTAAAVNLDSLEVNMTCWIMLPSTTVTITTPTCRPSHPPERCSTVQVRCPIRTLNSAFHLTNRNSAFSNITNKNTPFSYLTNQSLCQRLQHLGNVSRDNHIPNQYHSTPIHHCLTARCHANATLCTISSLQNKFLNTLLSSCHKYKLTWELKTPIEGCLYFHYLDTEQTLPFNYWSYWDDLQ